MKIHNNNNKTYNKVLAIFCFGHLNAEILNILSLNKKMVENQLFHLQFFFYYYYLLTNFSQ